MSHPYTIALDGGKYMIKNDSGLLTFFRYGEPWPAAEESLAYANVVASMAQRIEELEVAIKAVLDGPLQANGTRDRLEGLEALSGVIVVGNLEAPKRWRKSLRDALEQK